MNHTVSGMTSQLVTRINDYSLWWELVSVAVGPLVLSVAVLTVLSTLTLAVMLESVSPILIGGISLVQSDVITGFFEYQKQEFSTPARKHPFFIY